MNYFRIPYQDTAAQIELDQLQGRIQHLEEQLATAERDRDAWLGRAKRLQERMAAARKFLNAQ